MVNWSVPVNLLSSGLVPLMSGIKGHIISYEMLKNKTDYRLVDDLQRIWQDENVEKKHPKKAAKSHSHWTSIESDAVVSSRFLIFQTVDVSDLSILCAIWFRFI